MAKDSQPDSKLSRMEKCKFQTPIISEEGKNLKNPSKKRIHKTNK
ncbi:hypothetical protein [Clostridium oceanicum]|uniref:Uncharacterized protein n=1 Tax=Clostridium oceanicum TaxID=1543 RepID=A0ABN1JFL1_9CLOT